jgi:hypothetical protein
MDKNNNKGKVKFENVPNETRKKTNTTTTTNNKSSNKSSSMSTKTKNTIGSSVSNNKKITKSPNKTSISTAFGHTYDQKILNQAKSSGNTLKDLISEYQNLEN